MKNEKDKRKLSATDSSEKRNFSFENDVVIYCKRLYKFLYDICHDEELSKDLLQDTMIQAQHHFMRGFYEDKFLIWCWLRTIAQNALMKHYRIQSSHRIKNEEYRQQICENLGWNVPFSQPMDEENPTLAIREQTKEQVGANISLLFNSHFRFFNLSNEEWRLINERHLQMKSFKELSFSSGRSLSTTMSRYYTAMKKVQRQLIGWEKEGLLEKGMDLCTLKSIKKAELAAARKAAREKAKREALKETAKKNRAQRKKRNA